MFVGIHRRIDSNLRNQAVIVGAHYDHDGEAFGQIWYGADDNGSGTVALLELAEAFGRGAPRPAKSIVLSAWAGEEKGLLGSRYYVSHPIFPLNRTVSMFQMDMIGRDEEHPGNRSQQVPEERASENRNALNVLGTAFSPDLKTVISRMNNQVGLTLHFRYDFGAEDLMRRSDQWSFLQKGIPASSSLPACIPTITRPATPRTKSITSSWRRPPDWYISRLTNSPQAQRNPQFVKASPPSPKPY
jgi:Zn-dependent M28 family amino/carboxypeptidase